MKKATKVAQFLIRNKITGEDKITYNDGSESLLKGNQFILGVKKLICDGNIGCKIQDDKNILMYKI